MLSLLIYGLVSFFILVYPKHFPESQNCLLPQGQGLGEKKKISVSIFFFSLEKTEDSVFIRWKKGWIIKKIWRTNLQTHLSFEFWDWKQSKGDITVHWQEGQWEEGHVRAPSTETIVCEFGALLDSLC